MQTVDYPLPSLSHSLHDYLEVLARFSSTGQLQKSLLYRSLKAEIEQLMGGRESGTFAPPNGTKKKSFYRMVAWNIERGINLDAICEILGSHPEISMGDLFYLTEADFGMARSGNKNVTQELARRLELNYLYAPGYLNLSKGNSIEGHYEGMNEVGLHGNALLSRYPLENFRTLRLKNCRDKMRGREKRIGSQIALMADVRLPEKTITAVVVHLDAHSSQRQRAHQMKTVLDSIQDNPFPVLLAGDLNTNCYNTRHGLFAFFGFWNKVFRGVDDVIDNHYPYPDRYYDRWLFKTLRKYQFDYEHFNETGVGTLHYHVEDVAQNRLIQEVVPAWCRRIMEETLRRHGGSVSLKLDWFAAKGLKVASESVGATRPRVIPKLKSMAGRISDHDPILVDVDLYSA